MSHPLISVVLPVYNRGRYVAATIQSILDQTYTPLELIVVVDEGSTDRSASIVRGIAARDERVRPLFLSHGNQWRARNEGVARARGDYIAHMDDDDIALPERLALQWSWLKRTGVDIVGGSVQNFGSQGGLLWFPETHQAICHELLFRISLFLPTVLLPASIAKANPYDETLVYSDYVWLTRVAHRYRFGNMPQILLRCRTHESQLHVVEGAAFKQDERRARPGYFQSLFPEATSDDLRIVSLLTEKKPFTRLADLRRAGDWLLRLGDTPDDFLRRRMAGRWQSACQRSAGLGWACYRLYRQTEAAFAVGSPPRVWKLKASCILRLRPGSRRKAWCRRAWNLLRRHETA